jgi:hypothetical protein
VGLGARYDREGAQLSVIHAGGLSTRHAIARALATVNRTAAECSWRVLSARVTLGARGDVARADVSLRVEEAGSEPSAGLVNPTGAHPMMARLPGAAALLDLVPVTWERWVRVMGGSLPPSVDPWVARTGVDRAQAEAYARAVGKRLPTPEEFRAAWGSGRYPWGDAPDRVAGLAEAPRYEAIPEVALYPPSRTGHFDLGAWLHQWCADGTLLGGRPGLGPGEPGVAPIGFRCAVDG